MDMRVVAFLLLVLISSSCSSRAMREARMPAPPVPSILYQSCEDVIPDSSCKYEPIVRFVNFEYNVQSDTVRVLISCSTSVSEGPANGTVKILTDEYELSYLDTGREFTTYEETLEMEKEQQYRVYRTSLRIALLGVFGIRKRKKTRVESGTQFFNSLQLVLGREDVEEMTRSRSIGYQIETDQCAIEVWPSKAQYTMLQRWLSRYE